MTAFALGIVGGAVGSVLTFLVSAAAAVLTVRWLARKVLG